MTAHPDVGKLLFGRSLRLEFGEWVHARGGEPFYVSEVQNALDTSPSGVHEELRRFTRLGMLDRMPKGGDRRQYYRKTGHPLWNVFATTRSVSGDPNSRRNARAPTCDLRCHRSRSGSW